MSDRQYLVAAFIGDWNARDHESIYEWAAVISTGARDETGETLYSEYTVYEPDFDWLLKAMNNDGHSSIEIKDIKQFNLLAKLLKDVNEQY